MSFWAGVASGFKDAKAAKAEKEELEARRAERKETFEYNVKRDEITDKRSEAKRVEDLRQWNITNDRAALIYEQGRIDRLAREELAQKNLDRGFFADQKWKKSEWGMKVEKWDLTKLTAEQTKERADALFDNTLDMQQYGKLRDRAEDLRKNRAEARAIAETLRQIEITKFNQEIADKNYAFREKQFVEQTRAAGVSEELAKQGFQLQKDELEIKKAKEMMSMIPASLASIIAGEGGGSAGSKGHAMSTEAMTTGSKLFNAEYKNLSDEAKESDFFKAAANSPATQATLMAFVELQAKKGNTVKLDELPKYFRHAGSVDGRGGAEAKETIDALMSGEMDLNDKDSFIKGLLSLKNYKPAEELFVQTGTPDDLKTKSEKIKYWETAIETDAYRKLDSYPPDDRAKIDRALTGLQRKERRTKSLDVLASYGLGMDTVMNNNMQDVDIIQSYYGNQLNKPVEVKIDKVDEVEDPIVPLVNPELPSSSNATDDSIYEAKSPQEFMKAKDSGYTGPIRYKGKIYDRNESGDSGQEAMLTNDKGEQLSVEDAIAAEFEEGGKLKEEGAVDKYFAQQAEGAFRVGAATTEEQVEGSKRGEKEIDTDTFVDRSFQDKPTAKKPMDLTEANVAIVTDKVNDVVDSIPPRTPKNRRVEWAIEEFNKKYKNASVHMSDEEIEVRITSLVNSVNQ
jgi:hypothetical protein